MDNCGAIGTCLLVGGVILLLTSITETGRKLDRAYLRAFGVRSEIIAKSRDVVGVIGGTVLIIIGIYLIGTEIYFWWNEMPCDLGMTYNRLMRSA
jgi:hypothetical protein